MDGKDQQLALAITEYLADCIKSQKVNGDGAEGLEVAIQAVNEAFGIDTGNADQIKKISIAPTTLSSVFDIYMKTKSQMKKVGFYLLIFSLKFREMQMNTKWRETRKCRLKIIKRQSIVTLKLLKLMDQIQFITGIGIFII